MTDTKNIEIDWSKVDRYLQAQCSGVGIASILGIHENTLYNRCKEDNGVAFMEYAALKKGEGKELLRYKQFEIAMKGDKVMLIWLGKQYLEQKENSDLSVKINENKLNELARTFEQSVVSTTTGSYVPPSDPEILESKETI